VTSHHTCVSIAMSEVRCKNLLEAVQRGRHGEVLVRLRGGEHVDTVYSMGRTATQVAAAKGDTEAISTLLLYQPDLAKCDAVQWNTCLHVAAQHTQALQALLIYIADNGGDLSLLNMKNKFGRTPLHECVLANKADGCKLLVDAGADTSIKDKEGRTPAQFATSRGNHELANIIRPGISASIAPSGSQTTVNATRSGPQCSTSKQLGNSEFFTEFKSIEEEKASLKRRLAELDATETLEIEDRIRKKKSELETLQVGFRSRREIARKEIFRLEEEIKRLEAEEKEKCGLLETELSYLKADLAMKKKGKDRLPAPDPEVVSVLECPVCLLICKFPLQVWQCQAGHIVCSKCKARPELTMCPQCRLPMRPEKDALSRNRALEELAAKLFPRETEKAVQIEERKSKNNGRRKKNVGFSNDHRN